MVYFLISLICKWEKNRKPRSASKGEVKFLSYSLLRTLCRCLICGVAHQVNIKGAQNGNYFF
jgi:hypothetical protein